MGNITPSERPLAPREAYSRGRRIRHAFWFIRRQAGEGSHWLETTKAAHVANTYGLDAALIRRIKARFRNELSFSPEGK